MRRWPRSASSCPRSWRSSAPAPNTARPSAGRHGISPPWPIRWPTRRLRVWLLGSAKDRAIGEQIVDQAQPASLPLNLCGATSLTQAIDLLAAAALCRLQRFRPDARRRRPRPTADRRLWLVVARLHAAALGEGNDHQP
jgi:hypothetical protein